LHYGGTGQNAAANENARDPAETTSCLRIGSLHLSARLITVMINER
jgi:hypothetical protein